MCDLTNWNKNIYHPQGSTSANIHFLLHPIPPPPPVCLAVFGQLLPRRSDPSADQLSDSGHQHQQRGADSGQFKLRRASHLGRDHALSQHGEAAAKLQEYHHCQVNCLYSLQRDSPKTHIFTGKKYFSGYFPFRSCLRAIRQLQKNGHIPSDASLFKSYAEYGHFVDVRVAALEALVDYTRGRRHRLLIYIVRILL